MKKLAAALIVSAVVTGLSGAVSAKSEGLTEGWIAGLDIQNDAIILDDGSVIAVPRDINFDLLKEGVRVVIEYRRIDGGREAVSITPAPERS
jgi:hypothetical protein